MALSGSNESIFGRDNVFRFRVEWSATQNTSANTSTVTARFYLVSTRSTATIVAGSTKTTSVVLDGTSYSFSYNPSLSANQKKLIGTVSKTMSHNSVGDKSFTLSATSNIAISGVASSISVSTSGTLNSIPRESTLSSDANWTAGSNKSISISRASGSFTHTVRMFVGTTKVKEATGVGASVTMSFNQAENTAVFRALNGSASASTKIEVLTYNGGTHIGTTSKNGTVTAPINSYASIKNPTGISTESGQGGQTVYIDQSIQIAIDRRHSDFTHTLQFKDGNSGAIIHTANNVTTSYTWTPNATEMAKLYAKIPNDIEFDGQIDLLTYYNGVEVRSYRAIDINYRAREDSCRPTFSASGISYLDTNTATTAITGDNQYIIQGKSTVRATISTGATALNGARIVNYEVRVDGAAKSIATTGSVDLGVVNTASNATLTVTAVDSRGFRTSVTKPVNIIPYEPPKITVKAERLNGFESQTTISVTGTASPITIGTANKNSITGATRRHKKTTESVFGTASNLIVSGFPKFTTTKVTLDFDNLIAWQVQVEVKDRLSTTTQIVNVRVGRPILYLDPDLKSIGIGDFADKENQLKINARVDIGSGQFVHNGSADDGVINIQASGKSMKVSYPEGSHSYIEWNQGGVRDGYIGFAGDSHKHFTIANSRDKTTTGWFRLGQQVLNCEGTTAWYNGVPVFTSDNPIIWTGAYHMNAGQTLNVPKKLSECPNGWILYWSYYDGTVRNQDSNVTIIHKSIPNIANGIGTWHLLQATGNTFAAKYLYIRNESIQGHSRNGTAPESNQVLRAIFSF